MPACRSGRPVHAKPQRLEDRRRVRQGITVEDIAVAIRQLADEAHRPAEIRSGVLQVDGAGEVLPVVDELIQIVEDRQIRYGRGVLGSEPSEVLFFLAMVVVRVRVRCIHADQRSLANALVRCLNHGRRRSYAVSVAGMRVEDHIVLLSRGIGAARVVEHDHIAVKDQLGAVAVHIDGATLPVGGSRRVPPNADAGLGIVPGRPTAVELEGHIVCDIDGAALLRFAVLDNRVLDGEVAGHIERTAVALRLVAVEHEVRDGVAALEVDRTTAVLRGRAICERDVFKLVEQAAIDIDGTALAAGVRAAHEFDGVRLRALDRELVVRAVPSANGAAAIAAVA